MARLQFIDVVTASDSLCQIIVVLFNEKAEFVSSVI